MEMILGHESMERDDLTDQRARPLDLDVHALELKVTDRLLGGYATYM